MHRKLGDSAGVYFVSSQANRECAISRQSITEGEPAVLICSLDENLNIDDSGEFLFLSDSLESKNPKMRVWISVDVLREFIEMLETNETEEGEYILEQKTAVGDFKEGIRWMKNTRETEHKCPQCGLPIGKNETIVLIEQNLKVNVYIHEDCIRKFLKSVSEAFSHTDDLMADRL